MRIRKRFPPTPTPPLPSLSSSSPAAAAQATLSVSSDPQLNRNPPPVCPPHIQPNSHDENRVSVVQDNNHQAAATKSDDPPPPNQEGTMIGSANPRWGFLTSIAKQMKIEEEGYWKEEEGEEEKRSSNGTRKESIGAEFNTSLHLSQLQSSSSRVAVGGWDEGDKTVLPLKKRKGISFDSAIITTSSNTVKEKMKSKTNKKCLSQNGGDHHKKLEGMEETDHANNNSGGSAKKSKRGSVIMEGSRCSRVNGRGWRCCQQTLVGYSLCEHHLGKGRLRSMTSVRNRGVGAASKGNHYQQQIGARDDNQIAPPPLALRENQEIANDIIWDRADDDNDEDDDEEKKKKKKKKALVKKRMKIGVVKARSISSLLGQTDVDNRAVGGAKVDGDKDKYGCEDEYYHV